MDRIKTPLLWLGVSGVAGAAEAITEDRTPILGFTLLGASLLALGVWVAGEVTHRHESSQKSEKGSRK